MPLTFPRDLPSCRYMRSEFVCQYFVARSLSGGLPSAVELAPPLWRANWQVETLTREEGDVWDAWLHSLRGGIRTFRAVPPKHRWPKAYPRGFAGLVVGVTPWSGIGRLTTISAQRDVATVSSVPIGLVMQTGDFVSLWVGNRQHLHRVVEDATANGSGVIELTLEPPLRPNASTNVAVRFAAPYCEMVLTGVPSVSRNGKALSFSFDAMQILIPSTVPAPDELPPTITSPATVSVLENAALAFSLTANEAVTWSIVGGVDAARFEISGSTLRWVGNGTQNFEAPVDANGDNAYVVQVRATDTSGNIADYIVTATVTDVPPPVMTSAASVSVVENVALAFTLTANETASFAIVGGVDAARFEISGSTLRWSSNGTQNFEAPTDANVDNVYQVQVRPTSPAGEIGTPQSISVTVENADDNALEMLAGQAGLAIDFTDGLQGSAAIRTA